MGQEEVLFLAWKAWVTITRMAVYWKVFLADKGE